MADPGQNLFGKYVYLLNHLWQCQCLKYSFSVFYSKFKIRPGVKYLLLKLKDKVPYFPVWPCGNI